MADTLSMLTGADQTVSPYGSNMSDPARLDDGYVPGEAIHFVPGVELGDGVQGPPQDQDLVIWRDNRPLAVDELGQEGPFVLPWVKVSHPVEGKSFPLNLAYGGQFDRALPGFPAELDPPGLQAPYPYPSQATPETVIPDPSSNEILYSTQGEAI